MNQRNYQRELEKVIEMSHRDEKVPSLFLHSCCAPCSSYVLEYLCKYFSITVFYYNPNISATEEYRKRVAEQKRLIQSYNEERKGYTIDVIEGDYRPEEFYGIAKGYEQCPEGGERCARCFDLRLRKTAIEAGRRAFDYFGTTLTISPLKNAVLLNDIGYALEAEYGIKWLPSDFKKKGGYQRSVVLSKEYDLYRQNYCGCVYSLRETMDREQGAEHPIKL